MKALWGYITCVALAVETFARFRLKDQQKKHLLLNALYRLQTPAVFEFNGMLLYQASDVRSATATSCWLILLVESGGNAPVVNIS
jgi:hypothetical protein